jgi:hypothetical protein
MYETVHIDMTGVSEDLGRGYHAAPQLVLIQIDRSEERFGCLLAEDMNARVRVHGQSRRVNLLLKPVHPVANQLPGGLAVFRSSIKL